MHIIQARSFYCGIHAVAEICHGILNSFAFDLFLSFTPALMKEELVTIHFTVTYSVASTFSHWSCFLKLLLTSLPKILCFGIFHPLPHLLPWKVESNRKKKKLKSCFWAYIIEIGRNHLLVSVDGRPDNICENECNACHHFDM